MTGMIDRPRPAPGAPREWAFPSVQRFTLTNGMQAVVCHVPNRALAAVTVALDAPLVGEPSGLDGVARITAQALEQGTERLDGLAFAAELERQGAWLGSSSGVQGISVSLDVPVSRLAAALPLLSEAVAAPAFPAVEVERLVQERLDGIRQEEANPGPLADKALARVIYQPAHRFSRPVGGSADTVSGIDRDAVVAFYQATVRPSTATVVVTGDVSGIDIDAVLEATLGSWTGQVGQRSVLTRPLYSTQPSFRLVDRPGSVQTELRFARPGYDRSEPEYLPASLAAYVLGGPLTSRLSTVLREEKGYTYGVQASAIATGRGGQLRVSTSVETSVTADAVAETLRVIAEFSAGGASDQERDDAIESRVAVAPLRLQTAWAIGHEIAAAEADRLPEDYVAKQYDVLRTVTAADISAAAARDWQVGDLTIVACGDAAEIRSSLDALGIGEITVAED